MVSFQLAENRTLIIARFTVTKQWDLVLYHFYFRDSIVIDNSILWNNSDANGYEISVNTGSVVLSNSLFDSSKSIRY